MFFDENEDTCQRCFGRGYKIEINGTSKKWVDCICKKTHKTKEQMISEKTLEEYIPNIFYRENKFEFREVERRVNEVNTKTDYNLEISLFTYTDFLEEYYSKIANGVKPTKSYFVVAPANFGKKFFVYECIKKGLKKGLKVSPLYSTLEVYEKMNKDNLTEFNEMLNVDVLFLTVGGNPFNQDMYALRFILELADRKGISILLISRFSANYFKKLDGSLVEDMMNEYTRDYDYGHLEHIGFTDKDMMLYQNLLKSKKSSTRSDIVEDDEPTDFRDLLRRD